MKIYKPHLAHESIGVEDNQAKVNRLRFTNLFYNCVTLALVCTVLFCGFTFANKYANDYFTQKRYIDMQGGIVTQAPNAPDGGFEGVFPETTFNINTPVEPQRPTTDYIPTELEKIDGYVNRENEIWDIHEKVNSEAVAWLYVAGTKVNYIVGMNDADYYLTHDINGRTSNSGALFMTSLNNLNPLGRNTLIHGHNMTNGSMFGELKYYTTLGTQSYFDTHRRIYFDTLYGTLRFEVFSVYITDKNDADYRKHSFDSDSTYVTYLNRIRDRGMFKDDTVKFNANDRVLTLSTCNSDEGKTKRTIVHARLVWPTPGSISTATPGKTTPGITATPGSTTPENITTPGTSSQRVVKLNDPSVPLKLREQPSTSSAVLAQLEHGTVVDVLDDQGDWLKVKVNGKTGYVFALYTVPYYEFDPDPTQKPTQKPTEKPTGGTTQGVTPDTATTEPTEPTEQVSTEPEVTEPVPTTTVQATTEVTKQPQLEEIE